MTSDVNVVISHSEYTVLVVDDVVSNVLLLKVLLTNEKFKVITAGNGKEALSQAVNARPDLILLDVMMPEMNGFEVAERLKADPETQHIPIIFLTALNTTADIVKGFKVGANDFISKPFNKEELVIRVTHQISWLPPNGSSWSRRKNCVRLLWGATSYILLSRMTCVHPWDPLRWCSIC